MGFMDKAKAAAQDAAKKGKELADQAQQKIEETQNNFNANQSGGGSDAGPAVEYDKNGRPIAQATPDTQDVTPPHGDPFAEATAAPPAPDTAPVPDTEDVTPPHGDPVAEAPKPPAPPSDSSGMTSGDPLAG